MKRKTIIGFVKNWFRQIDWKLLLFLLLFLNVKLAVKIIAVILIYILRFNVHFGFRLRVSRLPLFYMGVITIALINWIAYRLYTNLYYDLTLLTGIFSWLLCILAIHQLKLSVDTMGLDKLHRTLLVFFMINAVVSLVNLLAIVIETGALNPYLYQGLFQKYFIGTGDHIRGVFFDTSTTNALINAFGVVYFLSRKQVAACLVCMIIVLLTGSNTTNILLIAALVCTFIFQSDRDQKSVVVVCLFLMIIFMGRVSPQNNDYALATIKDTSLKHDTPTKVAAVISNNILPTPIAAKQDSMPATEEKKRETVILYLDSIKLDILKKTQPNLSLIHPANPWIRPSIPHPSIHSREYQRSRDTTVLQKELVHFVKEEKADTAGILSVKRDWENRPGKMIALQQTLQFLQRNPNEFTTGDGMGNFSSKLAFKVTALKIAGGYPSEFAYINPAFRDNHLALFLYYFTKPISFHSVVNTPDSVYDQLLGEYGIMGLGCFLLFYAWFFIRHIKKLSYGIAVLFMMAAAFGMGYWFEQFSVVIMFELLLLMDIKSNSASGSSKREMV